MGEWRFGCKFCVLIGGCELVGRGEVGGEL